MVKGIDSTSNLSSSQLLDGAPMVLVVLDGAGEILVANGEHLGEVLGEAGPYVGRVLFELPNIAMIFGDLVRRALTGPTSIGRLALTKGFLQVRAVPTVSAAGRVCGVVVIGTPEVAQARDRKSVV